MNKQQPAATLICTLGTQPQVVTFALDYLLARNEPIQEVIVLHLARTDPAIDDALHRLQAEFEGERYRDNTCRFRLMALRGQHYPLSTIRTTDDAEKVRQFVHGLINTLKQQNRYLHLCIAGGPRMIALMTLSVVMLHCGHQDKVWHLYTEPNFLNRAKRDKCLHDPTGQQVWLMEVPLVPWGAYFAPLRESLPHPSDLAQAQTAWLDQTDHDRCQQVWDALTPRQQEVLRAFAGGLNTQQVAEKLVISIATVNSHKTRILTECKITWELAEETYLTFHFLHQKFANFFSHHSTTNQSRKNR